MLGEWSSGMGEGVGSGYNQIYCIHIGKQSTIINKKEKLSRGLLFLTDVISSHFSLHALSLGDKVSYTHTTLTG